MQNYIGPPTRVLSRILLVICINTIATSAMAAGADGPVPSPVEALVDALVSEGIVPPEKREQVLRRVQKSGAGEALSEGEIRVQEVPESIKEEIRDQVRHELKEDVVKDIVREARVRRWGVPGAWPEWVDRLRFHGDVRFRGQSDNFDSRNVTGLPDVNAINKARSIATNPPPILNTTEDRERLRIRARLGLDAEITRNTLAGVRIATGSLSDPVSTNQTLGSTFRPYDIVLDQAYLRLQDESQAVTGFFGRMPNPFLSTDLVWDPDLNFDGLAVRLAPRHIGDGGLVQYEWDPFLTLGAFPIQEVELSSDDKWIYGAQAGLQLKRANGTRMRLGLAYYVFDNITGIANPVVNDRTLDYTAPQFVQKGNALFAINNDTDPNALLLGLAAEYEEINLTFGVDLADILPHDLMLQADYVKNIGFDHDDIQQRTGLDLPAETEGYQFGVGYGRHKIADRGDWQVFGTIRHLEADAVVDAFTDSDFHLGGTNAEGWTLGTSWGLRNHLTFTARYLSSSEITGPSPYNIDTIQLDLTGSF